MGLLRHEKVALKFFIKTEEFHTEVHAAQKMGGKCIVKVHVDFQ